MDVLVAALEPLLADAARTCGCWSPAAGEAEDFLAGLPPAVAGRVDLLGQVSEADKARMLRSVDVYCAPNTGQESFGVILLEAMAARAADRRQRHRARSAGCSPTAARPASCSPPGDSGGAGRGAGRACSTTRRARQQLVAAGTRAVRPVRLGGRSCRQVLRVYELAIAGAGVRPGGAQTKSQVSGHAPRRMARARRRGGRRCSRCGSPSRSPASTGCTPGSTPPRRRWTPSWSAARPPCCTSPRPPTRGLDAGSRARYERPPGRRCSTPSPDAGEAAENAVGGRWRELAERPGAGRATRPSRAARGGRAGADRPALLQ